MIIYIKVYTNCNKSEFVEENNVYKAYLKSIPVNHKANEELVSLLKNYFQIPKKSIEIIKGLTGKNKVVLIKNSI